MTQKQPAVYILASQKNGTLYIGVTSSLPQRIWQHKNDVVTGFSQKYQTHLLVWYELHNTMESATQKEKQLKNWKRDWKINSIEKMNPNWDDLSRQLY